MAARSAEIIEDDGYMRTVVALGLRETAQQFASGVPLAVSDQ